MGGEDRLRAGLGWYGNEILDLDLGFWIWILDFGNLDFGILDFGFWDGMFVRVTLLT